MTTEGTNDITPDEKTKQKGELWNKDAIFWGGALIWAGLVFWADSFGYLPQVGGAEAWSWIFLGAGVYGFVLAFVSLASPNLANPGTWDYIWAGIFVLIGLGDLTNLDIIWPLILLLVGVAILVNALRRSQ